MEGNKIRVGITHGDINGVGYEVILKAFSDPLMFDLCTPVIYGSPKVAAYHCKAMDIQTNFSIVNSPSDIQDGRLNIINCSEEELKVELTKPTVEAGKAALSALERALHDYSEGVFDVLVTAPINKHTIQSDVFHFPGHTEYIEERVGEGNKALMILLKGDFRMALVTGHIPVGEITSHLTKELIMQKLEIFHQSLKKDFGIDNPRIAVFSLNPHAGDNGLIGSEEATIIKPAIEEMVKRHVQCFGPYPADGFMGAGNYRYFDGILAMYHDQGLAPFKALAMDEGVNFTAQGFLVKVFCIGRHELTLCLFHGLVGLHLVVPDAAADDLGGLMLHQFFTLVATLHTHIFVFDFMDFSVSEQQRFR